MADLRYRVILEPEDDGSGYNVVIPAFPHGHTFGANVEECLANAREVIELELDYLRDKGLPVPESDHADAPIAFISVPSSAA